MGTRSADLDFFDEKLEKAKLEFIRGAEDMRAELNQNGARDLSTRMQPQMPKVDETLIVARIAQRWYYTEPDGTVIPVWCKGTVVGVKTKGKVRIEWDDEYLRDSDPKVTEEVLLVSKWNKHVETGWRCIVDDE